MPRPTNSVVIALRVLEQVSQDQPVGVSGVAKALDVPKSTAYRMLTTLASAGWIRQDTSGAWSLTLKAGVVGSRVAPAAGLADLARPVMTELSAATEESVRLWLVEKDTFLLVADVEGPHPVRAVVPEIAADIPLHATAVGKAILATWPDADLDAYLAAPLRQVNERTVTDPAELRRQVVEARVLGYARVWKEAHDHVGGVAAAIVLPDGRTAALAVTFPTHRLSEELVARFGALLTAAAARIGTHLRA
ncbi:IclR family transcriptional regulator [Uniformispora flossi]|uniref:IclR family transcriptional regulator n=1 Tax=Uniformispora flossi TaxID=3390723 RepID=UPI003C2F193A